MQIGWSALARRDTWALAAGDALVFVVFATLGHRDHGETSNVISVVGTALPFVAGWFLVAPWAGAYSIRPGTALRSVLMKTEIGWICAWPVSLLIRALVLQRSIPFTFFIVTLLFNTALLLGWRTAYTLLARRLRIQRA